MNIGKTDQNPREASGTFVSACKYRNICVCFVDYTGKTFHAVTLRPLKSYSGYSVRTGKLFLMMFS